MQYLYYVVAAFAAIGALDRIFGNKLKLGTEFERGFMLLGKMALSMVGMIVLAPAIADLIQPVTKFIAMWTPFDPSFIAGSLLANDMGGAPLAESIALNEDIGRFNGYVTSSMLGCTISFTIPVVLEMVKKEHHEDVMLGLLCGVVTIPVGCFVGGLIAGISIVPLLINLIPLVVFSGIVAIGLLKAPKICVKLFKGLGILIKALITLGLVIGITEYFLKIEIYKGFEDISQGSKIIFNAAMFIAGMFPLMAIVSKLLSKPLALISKKLKINSVSSFGIISSLVTSMTAYDMMDSMDEKGVVLNSAFTVSGAFVFASHLAFTAAGCPEMVGAVVAAKLSAGVLSVLVATLVFGQLHKKRKTLKIN